jgi:hypothetical protein
MPNLVSEQLKNGLHGNYKEQLTTALDISFESEGMTDFLVDIVSKNEAIVGILRSPKESFWDEEDDECISPDGYWLEFGPMSMELFREKLEIKLQTLNKIVEVDDGCDQEILDCVQYYRQLEKFTRKHPNNMPWLNNGVIAGAAILCASSEVLSHDGPIDKQRLAARHFLTESFHPLIIPPSTKSVEGFSAKDQLMSWLFQGKPIPLPQNKVIFDRFPATQKTKPKPKKLERDLEAELLFWLDQRDVMAEQQVIAKGKRTDIWIPGKCFLELKRNRVTGDDVCQAANYYTLYSRQVVLVGETLSPSFVLRKLERG